MGSLIGRWYSLERLPTPQEKLSERMQAMMASQPPVELTYEFAENGSYSIESQLVKNGRGLVALDQGEYSITDGKLKLRLHDTKWRVKHASLLVRMIVSMKFWRNKTKIIANANNSNRATMNWIDVDTVELTNLDGTERILYRIAE